MQNSTPFILHSIITIHLSVNHRVCQQGHKLYCQIGIITCEWTPVFYYAGGSSGFCRQLRDKRRLFWRVAAVPWDRKDCNKCNSPNRVKPFTTVLWSLEVQTQYSKVLNFLCMKPNHYLIIVALPSELLELVRIKRVSILVTDVSFTLLVLFKIYDGCEL